MVDRTKFMKNINEEKKLRELVRKTIRLKRKKARLEEKKLRNFIRKIILLEAKSTDVASEVPHRSTGINILEDLLKKIIPILEDDYKALTSNEEQRISFRAHIVSAVKNSLTPTKVNIDAAAAEQSIKEEQEEQSIDVRVGDETDDAFIDIQPEEEVPQDPRDDFGLTGQDKTGRNMAYSSFNKVEKNVLDAYDLLSSDEDREIFYDYLITNLKLYFDKFEDELQTSLQEPTTPEYEQEKTSGEEL